MLKRATKTQAQLRGKADPAGLLDDERASSPRREIERVATRANSPSLGALHMTLRPTEFAPTKSRYRGRRSQDRRGSTLAARHKRIWKKERISFDPVHYLPLERKPPLITPDRWRTGPAREPSLLGAAEIKLGHLEREI